MALPGTLNDREHLKFKESTAVAGQPAVAIVNPDGTNVGGSGGTSSSDKDGFVEGSSSLTPSGGAFNDALAAVSSGVKAMFRMTAYRALHVNLRDASGVEITSLGGGTQYAEDGAASSGELLTMAGVVRHDSPASSSGTDGDRSEMGTDASGRLWTHPQNVASDQADGHSLTLGATTDAAATGDGTIVAILKRLRTLLNGGLPAALATGGGLKTTLQDTAGTELGTFTNPIRTNPTNATATNVAPISAIGAANVANGQVSVTTTAGNIVAARATRRSVTIVNHGTTAVYVGVATVTTGNGVLLPGVVGAAITIDTTLAIQGIVGSGTQTVSYWEEYD